MLPPQPVVLVVEDDAVTADVVQSVLETNGYAVQTAASGTAALARVEAGGVDLVLLDLLLPRMDGLEVCRRVRARDEAIYVPVILLTALDSPTQRHQGFLAGADDFLSKPFDVDELLDRVRTWTQAGQRLKACHQRLLRDVEARRHAEQARRESEERFRSAFEHAPIGMAIVSAEGRWLQVNRSLCEIVGYTEAELLATTRQAITYPDDRELDLGYVRQLLADERRSYQIEKRYVHKRGHLVWVLLSVSLVRDSFGAPLHFISQIQDITRHKQGEAARAQLAAIVESSADAIIALTLDGTIASWNPGAERLYGYAAEEVIGQPMTLLLPPDRHARARQFLDRVKGGERISNLETVRVRKDGSLVDVSVSLSPIRDVADRITGVATIARDISQRKRAEQVLHEREEQLRQAQKMEAIGQLAGGVAHDFNNLLTAINGYAELLLLELAPEDPRHVYADEIARAGERAANLTHQLLAFSRRQVLVPEVLDLNAVVANMERMLQRLIGEDVELVTMLRPGLGCVRADCGQLEQVILNLAANARDAMPRGGRLTIETANVDLDHTFPFHGAPARPGPYVLLAVSDTGQGIDPATQDRIFEPFFTTKEPGRGTGLGLSSVYGIVKQSEGYIAVHSELGRGTTFRIYLPRVASASPAAHPPAASASMPQGTETVLLVEDEQQVRTLVQAVLEERGYRVLAAARGDEALRIGEQYRGPIHLLVTDVVMPGLSGRELAQRLAQRHPAMRVLYMSGYTDHAIVRHGLLDADVGLLQKPFTVTTLAQRIRQVLDAPPPRA